MAFASAQEAVAALAARSASLADLREIVTRFPELRPVVAAYPQTDQPLLDWLGGLHDPLIDAQLAKRPGVTEFAETVFRPDPAGPGATPPTPDLEPTVVRPLIQGLPGPSANPTPPSYSSNYPAGYDGQNRPPVPGAAFTPGPQQVPAQADAPLGQAADKGRKRSALPVIAISVLALVLVGGGVWAAFATGLFGGGASAKPTSASVVSSVAVPSHSPAASASSAGSASASPSAPATTPAAAAIRCWDGTVSTDGSACSLPTGKDAGWSYLSYAYPSLAGHTDCEQVASTGGGTYKHPTVMWECELGDALIRYRYWESAADATGHYDAKFTKKSTLATYAVSIGGQPATGWIKTDKDTAKGPGGIKRVVLTMWLPDQHLSMSVEGNTKTSMWAAFDLVRTRPLAQLLGHLDGTEPDEAPITAVSR